MRYRRLPGTELDPSVIVLGTASFGTAIAADDSWRLLDAFLECGGNFVDTAHIYGDWASSERSMSEKTIGAWLERTGMRGRVVLATKGAHLNLQTRVPRMRPEEVRSDLRESLEYLRTDVIDLYWLHRDDPAVPVGEILDVLEEERRAGTIRHYGCSNWGPQRILEAAAYAASRGQEGFVANQLMWSLALPNPEGITDKTLWWMDAPTYAYHRRTGLAAVAYSSQAKGFFSGKYGPGLTDAADGRRAGVIRQYYSPENFERLAAAQAIAARRGCSANDVALAYLIHQPFATYAIVGPRSVEQLRDSCRAADVTLTEEEVRALNPWEDDLAAASGSEAKR
mgnify:CR=1 FL=1